MKMTAVLVLAFGVLALLRHRSAALRHWVLAVSVACAAMMPVLEMVVPPLVFPVGEPSILAVSALTGRQNHVPGVAHAPDVLNERVTVSTTEEPSLISTSAVTSIAGSLHLVWLAGICLGFLILVTGLGRLNWLAARSRRLTHGRWRELADEISSQSGIRRPFLLLQSDHPSLLVTWGLVLPKIILPAAARDWTEERARVVLSHELAHIRRGDWIVQMAAELLRSIYWFNPVLWLVCRRLRLESEHACDDEVMNRGVAGSAYAEHLIGLAKALHQRRYTWFPAPAMARPSSLERRIRAMLNDGLNRNPIGGRTRFVIFVLLFGAAATLAAAQNMFQTFSGTVFDSTGRPVPGVTLVLQSAQRQAKYEVKTNDAGAFEFVGLLSGDYALEAKVSGFVPLTQHLTLAGQNVQRRLTLEIGGLQETIAVNITVDDRESSVRPAVREARAPDLSGCVATAMGGRIIPPRKIKDVRPEYPSELRGTGTQGTVILTGRIGLDGFLTDLQAVGNPQPELANSAIAAVREWRYSQTLLNCTPVEPKITVTTSFRPIPPPPPPPPKP
jgi:beta-lactamase regulating signal transducer with metallopeptidase domain